jgi:hypothetical protein
MIAAKFKPLIFLDYAWQAGRQLIYVRQSVGQSVLVSGAHLGPVTNFSFSLKFLLDSCGFVIRDVTGKSSVENCGEACTEELQYNWKGYYFLHKSNQQTKFLTPMDKNDRKIVKPIGKHIQLPKRCVFYYLEIRTMDNVQKPSKSECYTPSSEFFRLYQQRLF